MPSAAAPDCSDIDAIATEIAGPNHHVADAHPDPEFDATVRWHPTVGFRHAACASTAHCTASTARDLTERRHILDRLIAPHRGRIANTAGDSPLPIRRL